MNVVLLELNDCNGVKPWKLKSGRENEKNVSALEVFE